MCRFWYRTLRQFGTLTSLALLASCESPTNPITTPRSGDAHFSVASSNLITSMVIKPMTAKAGQNFTITAVLYVDGHPLGGREMSLYIDGAMVDSKHGSRLGTAEFKVPGLAAGTHRVSVEFPGDNIFFGSESWGWLNVTP